MQLNCKECFIIKYKKIIETDQLTGSWCAALNSQRVITQPPLKLNELLLNVLNRLPSVYVVLSSFSDFFNDFMMLVTAFFFFKT